MPDISIEIVPRNEISWRADLQAVRQNFPQVRTINIPEAARFELRSLEAAAIARQYYPNCIPHLRAVDLAANQLDNLLRFLNQSKITQVLVISGDCPPAASLGEIPASLRVIRQIKRRAPDMIVYAGIDPYRQSIKQEKDYIEQKLAAGADGFFTQPFFDLRLVAVYQEILEPYRIYWGFSPVTSLTCQKYWEQKNKVVFPKNFQPTLTWNRKLAWQAIKHLSYSSDHLYFMPIKVDILAYLGGIL